MKYEEVINDRRSARGYLDKPVPKRSSRRNNKVGY